MTKKKELDAVRDLAKELGPDSYLGPWLESILPELESDLRSDILPTLSLKQAKDRARDEALRIVGISTRKGEEIIQVAQHKSHILESRANNARNSALEALRLAIRTLETA